jgi:hypothetical protein
VARRLIRVRADAVRRDRGRSSERGLSVCEAHVEGIDATLKGTEITIDGIGCEGSKDLVIDAVSVKL